MSEQQFDLIVFGATSFVGEILAGYLLKRHGVDGDLKWAIAGRSAGKLKELQSKLGAKGLKLKTIIADAADEKALERMCKQTRVVVSTVGPYALFGSPLVKVCAETGTDYCDLTGEVQWIKRMLDTNENAARKSGARIVHCCGFDSIPSDLGVLHHQQVALEKIGAPASEINMRVRKIRGGASGGTVASMMNIGAELTKDPALRKALMDPYLICPTNGAARVRQKFLSKPEKDAASGKWMAPFIMGAINTRVVLRSNALAGYPYGQDFKYDEAMLTGKGLKGGLYAGGVTAAMGGFFAGTAFPPTAWAMKKFVVPKPGEGPSPEEQKNGLFDVRLFSNTGGNKLETRVTGDRDPGYGSTAKMLGEAAVCLAGLDKSEKPGGFWTPATALGNDLIERLKQHAGLKFEVVSS